MARYPFAHFICAQIITTEWIQRYILQSDSVFWIIACSPSNWYVLELHGTVLLFDLLNFLGSNRWVTASILHFTGCFENTPPVLGELIPLRQSWILHLKCMRIWIERGPIISPSAYASATAIIQRITCIQWIRCCRDCIHAAVLSLDLLSLLGFNHWFELQHQTAFLISPPKLCMICILIQLHPIHCIFPLSAHHPWLSATATNEMVLSQQRFCIRDVLYPLNLRSNHKHSMNSKIDSSEPLLSL